MSSSLLPYDNSREFRYAMPYRSISYYTVLVTRSAGATTQVLLLRRRNTGRGDGSWDGPAGGVEQGESLVEAAVRELSEEVGVVAEPEGLVEIYREVAGAEPAVEHVFLRTAAWAGTPRNLEPHRADRLEWFSVSELPSPMLPFVTTGLNAISG